MLDKTMFRDAFSSVRASDELLMEVLNMSTNETMERTNGRRPRQLVRILLAAALILSLLTVTAVAAVGAVGFAGETEGVLDSFFGNGGDYASHSGVVAYDENGKLETNMPGWCREPMDREAAQRLVAPYLYTIDNNTVTKGGYTYTIHAMLWDSATSAYLVYWSVENPDGLGEYRIGENGEFITTEQSQIYAAVGARKYIDTVNSTDTKLYLNSYDSDWGDELWCELGRRESIHVQPDAVRLTLPRSDRGGMATVTAGDMTISPVAIRFDGMTDGGQVHELVIVYDDGREYTVISDENLVDNTVYSFLRNEGYATYIFNRIVDVEHISTVSINGMVYPIS